MSVISNKDNRAESLALWGTAAATTYSALHGGGISESARWIVAFLGLSFALLLLSKKDRLYNFPPRRLLIPWAAFILWAAFTSLFSLDRNASFGEILHYLGIFALGSIVFALPKDRAELRKILLVVLAGSAIVTIVGWALFLHGRDSAGPDMMRHFVGPFMWKNPMATYLILFIPLVLVLSAEKDGALRIALLALSTAMTAGLLLTRSRAGWLSAVVVYCLILAPPLLKRYRPKRLAMIFGVAALGLLAGFLLSPEGAIGRQISSLREIPNIQNAEDQSSVERLALLKAGLAMIADYPAFGIGTRAWPSTRGLYLKQLKFAPTFPHNAYLRAATETGVLGLALLLVALFFSIWPLIRASFANDSPPEVSAITAGVCGVLVHFSMDIGSAYSGIILPMAVLIALGSRLISEETSPRPIRGRGIILATLLLGLTALGLRGLSGSYLEGANDLAQSGSAESALSKAKIAAALNPLSTEPLILVSRINLEHDDHTSAIKSADKAIRRNPTLTEPHQLRAEAMLSLGDTVEALLAIDRAIELSRRGDPDLHFRKAEILTSKGDLESAEKAYISAIDAMAPFVTSAHSAKTAGFRYLSSIAWENLSKLWSLRGDSVSSEIAAINAEELQKPRETDYIAKELGFDTPSPEITVIRLFEAIGAEDTTAIRGLSVYTTGNLPHFSEDISITVDKILDVRQDFTAERSEVDVLLKTTNADSTTTFAKSRIRLVIFNGRWAVTFEDTK